MKRIQNALVIATMSIGMSFGVSAADALAAPMSGIKGALSDTVLRGDKTASKTITMGLAVRYRRYGRRHSRYRYNYHRRRYTRHLFRRYLRHRYYGRHRYSRRHRYGYSRPYRYRSYGYRYRYY